VPGAYAQDVRARHARTWHAVCDVHHARKAQAVRWCSAPAVVHGAGPLWCASKTWMDGGVKCVIRITATRSDPRICLPTRAGPNCDA
jgi:hypothetical protein